jgi:hypothetical protein
VVNLTDLDVRYADHATRVARVGREGWLREASAEAGARRPQGVANGVRLVRRHLGGALVRAGERLGGTLVRPPADPAAA